MNIRHVGIPLTSGTMDELIEYNTTILGLKVISDIIEPVRIVKFEDKNGMVFERLQYASQGLGKEPHVAFTRDPSGLLIEVVTPKKDICTDCPSTTCGKYRLPLSDYRPLNCPLRV